jgi:hypothetical protein
MTLVVMRDAFHVTQAQRQHRLRALERLALTFLVHAQYQCIVRRVQVQADDCAQLLDEERIGGKFKTLGTMGFESKELEIALHAALGDTGFGRRGAHAPMRRTVLRPLVQRLVNQRRNALIIDRARFSRAQFIVQLRNAMLYKTLAPVANRRILTLEAPRHLIVGLPSRTREHNAHADSAPQASSASARTKSAAQVQLRSKSAPPSVAPPFPLRYLQFQRYPNEMQNICHLLTGQDNCP